MTGPGQTFCPVNNLQLDDSQPGALIERQNSNIFGGIVHLYYITCNQIGLIANKPEASQS